MIVVWVSGKKNSKNKIKAENSESSHPLQWLNYFTRKKGQEDTGYQGQPNLVPWIDR